MIPVVIIGAGIAGLSCARQLSRAGVPVVVLDKGRGIGGRVATRRAGDAQFDHGAQFVTAKDAAFAALLDELAQSGAVASWDDGKGRMAHVGKPGMSSLAKALGEGLDVRLSSPVSQVRADGSAWAVHLGDQIVQAARVVITVPAPQVAALIGADHPLMQPLRLVRYAPCLTLMALSPDPAPWISRRDPDDPLSWIACDSSKPGRPTAAGTAWVAQASLAFSQKHLEEDMETMAKRMLPLLCDRIGTDPARIPHAVAHRWRHALVTHALGQPFLRAAEGSLHLGGDWCLDARVEAAWTSGTAIAADILDQMA